MLEISSKILKQTNMKTYFLADFNEINFRLKFKIILFYISFFFLTENLLHIKNNIGLAKAYWKAAVWTDNIFKMMPDTSKQSSETSSKIGII